ncbi:hypothetical protein [Mycobacterium sp. PSTR-4-N]|uniref:hypothetical protein n=1 Tax=Mycobacterium sp. PSTR-4-N TaxID=2917745 RepID=UPI001F154B71|nr:hypothetical protein [Mycobacterium sp. PSTR-4-N]MCG7593723.1 hypothetical protein [Mycobacterium sp. PSTR-4-N]
MPEVGDVVPSRRGWITVAPTRCLNLHPLGPQQVLVGHLACTTHRGGHTTWTCRDCDVVIYGPPIDPLCSVLNGPAAVRNSFGQGSAS